MGTCNQREEKCTNLIEADAGDNLLHAPLKLTIWCSKGDVSSIGDTVDGSTPSGHAAR